MTYAEKLKDPRWQKKRLEVLKRDDWACQNCFDTESTLHVHHRVYKKGKDPWDYKDSNFVSLCSTCHEEQHEEKKDADSYLIAAVRLNFLNSGIGDLADGFVNIQLPHVPEVTASILNWALRDKKIMHMLCDIYFESLKERIELSKNATT